MMWILLLISFATVGIVIYMLKKSMYPMLKIAYLVYLLNFCIGHIILLSYRLIFEPESTVLLADTRLLEGKLNIEYLLFLNVLQLLFVCSGILLTTSANSKRNELTAKSFPPELNTALVWATSIGWIGNVAGVTGNVNLYSAFHPFELLGTAWIVSGFRLKPIRQVLVFFLASLHLFWAVLIFHSKSEAFLILVALLIRFLHSETSKKGSQIMLVSISALFLFPFIQVQKGILTLSKVQMLLVSQGEKFSLPKSFAIGFLQRFDGADSITDAYSAGAGSWYSFLDYSKLLITKFIPNISFLLGNYFGEETSNSSSLGQLWNDQMRPFSMRNVTYGVAVTFGPMAEGFSIGGLSLGIFLCILFGALIGFFCKSCYSIKLLPTLCGLYFMFHLENLQNSFGNLILMLSKVLQCYLLLKICYIIVIPIKKKMDKIELV